MSARTPAASTGPTGLGGAVLPAPRRAPEQTPAWDALYAAAARMPGELTLVATGPLTNVAIALTAHPALRSLLRGIALMGGAAVGGNRTPCSEFNIHADPDAAEIVFSSGIPIVMCGWTSRSRPGSPRGVRRPAGHARRALCPRGNGRAHAEKHGPRRRRPVPARRLPRAVPDTPGAVHRAAGGRACGDARARSPMPRL